MFHTAFTLQQKMGDKHRESEYEILKPFITLKNDMGSEDIHYAISYKGLPKEFEDIAYEELNETEENKTIGLLKLKDFLKGKSICGVDDQVLITVLRSCKYKIKKSEAKLMKYLQTQDMVTKWLQTADLQRLENVMNNMLVGILPYRDKYGRAILYTTPYDVDFELFDMSDGGLCGFCLLQYALSFPITSVAGIAYIGECKTASISVLYPIAKAFKQYIPNLIKLPFRVRKASLINENFIVRWAWTFMKPLVPLKVSQRVTFHGSDIQGLQESYNPAILPDDFGGNMGPLKSKILIEDILNFTRELKSRKLFLQ